MSANYTRCFEIDADAIRDRSRLIYPASASNPETSITVCHYPQQRAHKISLPAPSSPCSTTATSAGRCGNCSMRAVVLSRTRNACASRNMAANRLNQIRSQLLPIGRSLVKIKVNNLIVTVCDPPYSVFKFDRLQTEYLPTADRYQGISAAAAPAINGAAGQQSARRTALTNPASARDPARASDWHRAPHHPLFWRDPNATRICGITRRRRSVPMSPSAAPAPLRGDCRASAQRSPQPAEEAGVRARAHSAP
jgi:hypothetical protein